LGSAPEERAGACHALSDRAGGGGRLAEQGHRRAVGLQPADGWPLARPFAQRGIDALHDEPRTGKPR